MKTSLHGGYQHLCHVTAMNTLHYNCTCIYSYRCSYKVFVSSEVTYSIPSPNEVTVNVCLSSSSQLCFTCNKELIIIILFISLLTRPLAATVWLRVHLAGPVRIVALDFTPYHASNREASLYQGRRLAHLVITKPLLSPPLINLNFVREITVLIIRLSIIITGMFHSNADQKKKN